MSRFLLETPMISVESACFRLEILRDIVNDKRHDGENRNRIEREIKRLTVIIGAAN